MAKQQAADSAASGNGSEDRYARYEQELADYLQERIKPGLEDDAVPDLARSIAKDLARKRRPDGPSEDIEEDDEPRGEANDDPDVDADDEYDDDPEAEADDEYDEDDEAEPDDDEADDEDDEERTAGEEEVSGFEEEMHQLQADLGDDWIVRFSVQGDNAWLTAEKEDGSQHVEAPTADVLREAVDLLEGS